ncbi:hypothetical protein D3C78_1130060 [compost metagenome]
MMKIALGYPDASTEKAILHSHHAGQPVDDLQPVTTMEEIASMQRQVRDVYISTELTDYLLSIVRSTRENDAVLLGASPRASLAFMMAVKAYAYVQSRDYVLPDDIKVLAPFILGHRVLLRPEYRLDSVKINQVLQQILRQIQVPVSAGL